MNATERATKPLGRKAYGHIGHLPNSRMGPSDHHCHDGQARIVTEKVRDKLDRIIVQEKLDGSCVAVAMTTNGIVPLGRAGYPANTSPFIQHRMFHDWVMENSDRFERVLLPGERIVGEWLAQAHGTRYALWHEPFVAFDIMREEVRFPFDRFNSRVRRHFQTPFAISTHLPMPVEEAMRIVQDMNFHNAMDPIEGVVYRCERNGEVDFLAKYVRPDKVDGCFLPEISGQSEVWNWGPP